MRPLIRNMADRLGFNPASWLLDTRRMRRRVREFAPLPSPHAGAQRFAIVVTPWMGTSVPWFSLACGLLLASRGNPVSFIVDDLPFGKHKGRFRFIAGCIQSALRPLRGRCEVLLLSEQSPDMEPAALQPSAVERLARLNAVWALRGELRSEGRARHVECSIRQLQANYGPIAAALGRGRFDAVFVPGGVWGNSGLWVECARAVNVRVTSYDSGGYGNLLLASGGIACQLQDIPRAFSMLKADMAAQDLQAFVAESARAEMARRRQGTDKFASQIQAESRADARFDRCVLIALNSSWDSAALGLHAAFDSSAQWIVETVRFLLDNTSAPVVVRQHPVERLAIARSNDDYRALLSAHFGQPQRLHFVAAEDPVNSYDLLERASAVVVYTSTIGLEAAAAGKPVVTESRSYYAGLGFVTRTADPSDYGRALADAATGRLHTTSAMRDDALLCYYLTQCCNWVFTPFTVEAFPEWSRMPLRELLEHDSVKTIVESLEQGVPVAYLNHRQRLAQRAE